MSSSSESKSEVASPVPLLRLQRASLEATIAYTTGDLIEYHVRRTDPRRSDFRIHHRYGKDLYFDLEDEFPEFRRGFASLRALSLRAMMDREMHIGPQSKYEDYIPGMEIFSHRMMDATSRRLFENTAFATPTWGLRGDMLRMGNRILDLMGLPLEPTAVPKPDVYTEKIVEQYLTERIVIPD